LYYWTNSPPLRHVGLVDVETSITQVKEYMQTLHKVFRLLRPAQQLKTGAVVLGALASGNVDSVDAASRVALLSLLWILLSSSVYIFNDISDLESDRLHLTKARRPLASGQVSLGFAYRTLTVLLLINLLAFPLMGSGAAFCALIYLLLNIAYSTKLKSFAVIDIMIVSSGFVLRGLSGVLIVDATPSLWFILLSLFGSLLLVSGKRLAQHNENVNSISNSLIKISKYSKSYLQQLQTISSSGLVISYVMMTQEKTITSEIQKVILELTIIPFISSILYINYYQDSQNNEDVTELLLSKRPLLYSGALWLVLFSLTLVNWSN